MNIKIENKKSTNKNINSSVDSLQDHFSAYKVDKVGVIIIIIDAHEYQHVLEIQASSVVSSIKQHFLFIIHCHERYVSDVYSDDERQTTRRQMPLNNR